VLISSGYRTKGYLPTSFRRNSRQNLHLREPMRARRPSSALVTMPYSADGRRYPDSHSWLHRTRTALPSHACCYL
jgi:hypothetical protein